LRTEALASNPLLERTGETLFSECPRHGMHCSLFQGR
jgi:hypothetical protein